LIKPILKRFQAHLPKISETEKPHWKQAQSGGDGELFSGNPNWEKLFKIPAPTLTTEEEAFIRDLSILYAA